MKLDRRKDPGEKAENSPFQLAQYGEWVNKMLTQSKEKTAGFRGMSHRYQWPIFA